MAGTSCGWGLIGCGAGVGAGAGFAFARGRGAGPSRGQRDRGQLGGLRGRGFFGRGGFRRIVVGGGEGRGHGEEHGHAHLVVVGLVEAGAGGDGNGGGQALLEHADEFLHVGQAEVARAADDDERVVGVFPDQLVAEQRAGQQLRDEVLGALVHGPIRHARPSSSPAPRSRRSARRGCGRRRRKAGSGRACRRPG